MHQRAKGRMAKGGIKRNQAPSTMGKGGPQPCREAKEGRKFMNASIKGLLKHFNTSWKCIEYDGKPLSKEQARSVLKYAQRKGYQDLVEVTDEDVEFVLNEMKGGKQ
jgi:hypothetical protein